MTDLFKKKPLVSVIMGIYNCADTLKSATDCIINQTYTNWELIMCDDGSTDNTFDVAQIIKNENPSRVIKVLQNEKNMGLNYTLNKCLKVAGGEYIARMDGDDLCSPERFEQELMIFETETEISIVSTDMEFFDESGVWGRISHPDYPQPKDLVYRPPFCHAPCMVKRETYDAVGGYTVNKKLLRVEDYHLWLKMYVKGYRGKNIHIPLYQMRDDKNATKRKRMKYYFNASYVKWHVVMELHLPKWMLIYTIKPIIVALTPKFFYNTIHRSRLKPSN